MKKLLISLLVFSFSSSVYSKDAESNGFRNINWQESFTKYIDIMSLSSKKGGLKKFYTMKNDDMTLGEVTLSSIVYVFYDDKFASVAMQTDRAKTNLRQVLIELKNELGMPSASNKYIHKYRWEKKNTFVTLKCFYTTYRCSIKYSSVAINKKIK